jgi:hypothetical protein
MSDVPTRQLVDETTQRVLQLLQQSGMLNDAKIDGAIIGRAKLQFTNISCTLRNLLILGLESNVNKVCAECRPAPASYFLPPAEHSRVGAGRNGDDFDSRDFFEPSRLCPANSLVNRLKYLVIDCAKVCATPRVQSAPPGMVERGERNRIAAEASK